LTYTRSTHRSLYAPKIFSRAIRLYASNESCKARNAMTPLKRLNPPAPFPTKEGGVEFAVTLGAPQGA